MPVVPALTADQVHLLRQMAEPAPAGFVGSWSPSAAAAIQAALDILIPPAPDPAAKDRAADRLAALERTTLRAGSVWRHAKGGLYTIAAVSMYEPDPTILLVTYHSNRLGTVSTRTLDVFRARFTPEPD